MSPRPSVSIVVPFYGDKREATAILEVLDSLDLNKADEAILVDNTEHSLVRQDWARQTKIVAAPLEQGSYYARNAGAGVAAGEWILFVDSDCRLDEDLLNEYFASPIDARCGIVAGGVKGASKQRGLVPSWARSRGHVGERYHIEGERMPAGITANLLVRSEAFAEVGGFHDGIRSGGDIEFCWRVQEAGRSLSHRPEASVEHVHVTSLKKLLRKGARYGAGRTWLNRRYPGGAPRPRLARELFKSALGAIGFTLIAQPRRGLFKLVDAAWYSAVSWGHVGGDNRATRARTPAPAPAPARILTSAEFPTSGRRSGEAADQVEAIARPMIRLRARTADWVMYIEDDPPLDRLKATAWLLMRRPGAVVRSLHRFGSLMRLAPPARRILTAGGVVIVPIDAGSSRFAVRLSELTGIAIEDPAGQIIGWR